MKAIRVHAPGGPEALRYEDVPQPTPGAGQLLVKVEATGVNFIDVYQRTGHYKVELPFTLGQEAAGVVTAVGSGVTGVTVGARVAYAAVLGAYAEYATVPADRVVVLPDGVSSTQGAAVMLQGMTAHYLASTTYPLEPRGRVGSVIRATPCDSVYGISKTFPVVFRPSSSRCASAACASGSSRPIRTFRVPCLIQPSSSPARATSSARVAM